MAKATKKVETTEELEEALEILQGRKAELDASISGRRDELAKLNDAQTADKSKTRDLERQIAEVKNRLFVRTALTRELLTARGTYLAQVRRAGSDKLTVRKQRQLQAGNAMALSSLQALCTHPLVFSYDGYGGSHSMDNDDAYHGHRVCTICNMRETSKGTKEDIYVMIEDDGTRLVRRDLRGKENLPQMFVQEWFSVGFLQQLFEASAGINHLDWPNTVDKKSVLIL